MKTGGWKTYFYSLVAQEISSFSRYFDDLVQWRPIKGDSGLLFDLIECPSKRRLGDIDDLADLSEPRGRRAIVLLNGTFNHHLDIQMLLMDFKPRLSRGSRVVAVAYNPYFRLLFSLANRLGMRDGQSPSTFVTNTDLANLAKLSGYEVTRIRPVAYMPFRLLGLGSLINRVMPAVPFLRLFSLVYVITLRPVISEKMLPSLTVVIPARNEAGNIENALKRMPDLGCQMEIIFVEGHSTDSTWQTIQEVASRYSSRFKIQAFQQTGRGKADAVRLGFSKATGDLLTILDADLTMPPEMLGRFYQAWCDGVADFINGSRLVYPMEGDAMRFLNYLGNIFFAKALSAALDVHLGDSLCGTKLVGRRDYDRIIAWRRDFGDFDPFGDFELLFPAAVLTFGIVDIPTAYKARTYGSTNIHRFRHGLQLLHMTLIGLWRIKLGRISR